MEEFISKLKKDIIKVQKDDTLDANSKDLKVKRIMNIINDLKAKLKEQKRSNPKTNRITLDICK
jgi:hypothetical protein